jgi:MFS family permease
MSMIKAESIPTSRRIAAFAFFMVADFFYGWSWNTADILRPDIRAALDLTLPQAGTMYSAQGLGALFGAIIIGQLADRLGRRNALFGIMVGYGISLAWGAYVASYNELLVQRFMLGIFMGGVFPVVVSLYTSLFDKAVCGKLAGFYNGTFNGSSFVLGFIASRFQVGDWQTLMLMGAIPALLLAPLAFILVPDDRKVIPYGMVDYQPKTVGKLPMIELFQNGLWKQTLLIALMIGLNFFAYQAFAGWQTTYLTENMGVSASYAKEMFGWQSLAMIVGGFAWGAFSDRFGRRINAAGFILGALTIACYLLFANTIPMLFILGCVFGLTITASVIWGPWLAELYPPHLRSTAASIFNWGRLISFFAPVVTGFVAEAYGMKVAMAMSAISFSVAAMVWFTLPETVKNKDAARV